MKAPGRTTRWAAIGVLTAILVFVLHTETAGLLTSATLSPGVVTVDSNPVAVALHGQTRRAFVLSRGIVGGLGELVGPGTVTVLDGDTGAIVRTVPVGVDPTAVAADEHTGRVFITNRGPPGGVSVLDASSGQVLRSVDVGVAPQAITLDDRAGRVLVVNRGAPPERGNVSFLDNREGTVLGEVGVDVYPVAVAVDTRLGRAFVANFGSNTVSVLDVQGMRVLKTVRLGPEPGTVARLAVDERTAHLFALSWPPSVTGRGPTDGRMDIIDERSGDVLKTIMLPNPTAMALNSRAGAVLVSSAVRREVGREVGWEGWLTALDVQDGAARWTARVGENPSAIAVDEQAERLFVADRADGTVSVLHAEGGRSRCTLPVGEQPLAMVVDNQTHRAFVVSTERNTVSILRPC